MIKKPDLSRFKWRTSSLSGSNGQCVKVAFLGEHVAVRDTKDPHRVTLTFRACEWNAFVWGIKSGELNDLSS